MKAIKLIHFKRPEFGTSYNRDKYYWISINDTSYKFSSRKDTLAFLAEINRRLNEQAHDTNTTLVNVYSEYRYYYFHLNQADTRAIETNLAAISKLFSMLIARSQMTNGNFFTFDRLRKINYNLQDILETLSRQPMNKLATVQRYKLKALQNRVKMLDLNLDTMLENI
mgnify:CR=1 FL=1